MADSKRLKTLFSRTFMVVALGTFLIGCSSSPDQRSESQIYVGDTPVYDPFEKTNRMVFAFNSGIDTILIHPIVQTYRFITPEIARTGLSNFLTNLKSPVHLANQILQGDIEGAGNVITRASVNTLIGVGGIIDVAAHEGIEHESEDFGQTMAVWGIGNGPYFVIPFLGPATLRDSTGFFIDAFVDPLNLYLDNIDQEALAYTRMGADYLVLRDSLMDVMKDLKRSSVDYYAATRSIYYQRRGALINDSNRTGSSGNGNGGAAYESFEDYDG